MPRSRDNETHADGPLVERMKSVFPDVKTAADLAERIGRSRTTVSNWSAGREPKIDALAAFRPADWPYVFLNDRETTDLFRGARETRARLDQAESRIKQLEGDLEACRLECAALRGQLTEARRTIHRECDRMTAALSRSTVLRGEGPRNQSGSHADNFNQGVEL